MLLPDGGGEQSGRADSVLCGDDTGAGAGQASEHGRQPEQRVDLGGHQDQVRVPAHGADEGVRVLTDQWMLDTSRHSAGSTTGAVAQRQPTGTQSLKGAATDKEPDVLAARGQPGSEPSSDSAGTDDDDPHACLLS